MTKRFLICAYLLNFLIIGNTASTQTIAMGFNVQSPVCVGAAPDFTIFIVNYIGATVYWTMPGATPGSTTTSVPGIPVITYSAPGIYSVTAYATNTTGTTAPQTKTLQVLPLPQLTVSPMQVLCAGAMATINGSGATSYTWMPGNITTSSFTVIANSPTVYSLTAAGGGCTAAATTTLLSKPSQTISATHSICAGTSLTLSACLSPGTYTWSNGSMGSSITYSGPVSSIVVCLAENTMGCAVCKYSVDVMALPVLSANSLTICPGTSGTLCALGAVSYSWTHPGPPISGTNACVQVTAGTTEVYTVTGTDANGCRSSTTATLEALAAPQVNSSTVSACIGDYVNLCPTGDATSYSWSPIPLNATISNSCFKWIVSGPLTFSLTGQGDNGCKSTVPYLLSVHDCAGIEEEPGDDADVFPNPASNFFNVMSPSSNWSISCYDICGRLVYKSQESQRKVTIDTEDWSTGIYYIRIDSERGTVTKKVVVE